MIEQKCGFTFFDSILFTCWRHTPGSSVQNESRNLLTSIQCVQEKTTNSLDGDEAKTYSLVP